MRYREIISEESADYLMAQRVDAVATAIIDLIPSMRPLIKWKGAQRISFYDLRGKIQDIPDLVVMFVFPLARAGVVPRQIVGGRPILLLRLPGLWLKSFDDAVVRSQTSLHHEIAHVLLSHLEQDDGNTQRPNKGADYFNLPEEIDAFLHQAIAGFERALRELPPDASKNDLAAMKAIFVKNTPLAFLKALTPANRAEFDHRVDNYLNDRSNAVRSTY
jgi:hypothetical protein